MRFRMSGVLLLAGFLLAAVALGRGRFDGVALLAVVAVLSALVRWLWEVSHAAGN